MPNTQEILKMCLLQPAEDCQQNLSPREGEGKVVMKTGWTSAEIMHVTQLTKDRKDEEI